MDLYTTSFTLPRTTFRAAHTISPLSTTLPLPGSSGPPEIPLPPIGSTTTPPRPSTSRAPISPPRSSAQDEADWEAVQKLVIDITTREGCLVTVTKEQPPLPVGDDASETDTSSAPVWNFHLSGTYQSVMAARGAVLREYPRDNRFTLKVPRTDVLESPLAALSAVKPDAQRRLEGIAAETQAHIAVVSEDVRGGGDRRTIWETTEVIETPMIAEIANGHSKKGSAGSHTSAAGSVNGKSSSAGTPVKGALAPKEKESGANGTSAPVTYGLKTERMCEAVVTGKLESVEVAKVLLLVLLDELSGLHAEPCEIDYKLHAIIAGRRRNVIQTIQEETGTNIYLPIPLVGILDRPQANGQLQNFGYRYVGGGGGMIPLSTQNTGMTQMTGYSQAPSSVMGNNSWHVAPQMTGSVGHGSMMGGYGPPHGRGHSGPGYNNHHHPQYPPQHQHYQPMHYDHHQGRGMPYPSHATYGHQQPMPVSMQHTGASTMTGLQTPRGGGPRHMGVGGHFNQHQQHHPQQHNHNHNQHFHGNHQQYNQQQQQQYMGDGHSPQPPHLMNPYVNGNGHNHVHVGLGGHLGMNNGMAMNGMGQGMGMGMNMGMAVPGHYGQGPHPGLSVHGGEQGSMGKANQIWITGEFFGVQRARDMLLNIAMQKSKLVISRDTAILPRKLDWLLTERLEDVKTIMSDNGTYMQVPSVGSQASLITVFGDHRVNIERTIRSIMALACQFYVASVWLLPSTFDILQPQQTLDPTQMQPILKRIAHATGAEVIFKSNCFEIHGLEETVRAAVFMVLELDVINGFHHEIRFQIELANEHRDFISGKKNGKINKIMKLAGVKIKFDTFNDYNFLMDIAGTDAGCLHGLSMLQEELPAELSFHVPQCHHKRIIGVAGKNIQRIMKLYGVYVKFSNAEEFAAIGGYADNEDNVVARTPAKNAVNLESLKQSITELVPPKDRDYVVETISVPRRYHRTLLGEKSIFIHDIEKKTNSFVRFPYKESASDVITIFGPESQVHIAAAMLLDYVPFEADLHVSPTPEMVALVASPDFLLFAERIKRDHQIAISPSANFGLGEDMIFKFRCQRSNINFLTTAREALEEFFEQHNNIRLYPANARKREDSFSDAFQHFNSKLLATTAKAAAKAAEAEGKVIPVKALARPIPTDVKALFDGPAQPGASDDMTSNGGRGFAGPLSYHDPRRSNTAEYWQSQSPKPIRPDMVPTPSAEPSKRESDPIIQDKVRQATLGPGVPLGPHHAHALPRASSARTQSLDITSLNFSRTLSSGGGGFGALPGSPAARLADSPNTASGQYFPSTSGVGGKGYSGLENVTNGLGNVHV